MCIVGAGVAGLVLAEELSVTGARVLVLESGDIDVTDADDLNEIESVGTVRVHDQRLVRNRVFGGTSATWSGRVGSLDDIDLAHRSWVPNSGWPIDGDDLKSFYDRSCTYLGVEHPSYVDRVPRQTRDVPEGGALRNFAWGFSGDGSRRNRFVHFGRRARDLDMPGVRCILNATVTDVLAHHDRSAVRGVATVAPDGSRRVIEAPIVVLAAGGIENARILLASRTQSAAGVGNERDQVGRYLMDHPRGAVGSFPSEGHRSIQAGFSPHRVRSSGRTEVVLPGLALTAEVQQAEGLLNCSAWVGWEISSRDPFAALSNAVGSRRPVSGLSSTARHFPRLARGAITVAVKKRSPERILDEATLQCMVEQAPNAESRVMLSDRVDRFGVPISRVDWRVGEMERHTVAKMTEYVVSELARRGLPIPLIDHQVFTDTLKFPDVAHPTGTTRMSSSPADGVVDRNAEVFGVRGLFVAGSSTFPTSGHINPTQTIVALTIRLADHLRQRAPGSRDRDPDR